MCQRNGAIKWFYMVLVCEQIIGEENLCIFVFIFLLASMLNRKQKIGADDTTMAASVEATHFFQRVEIESTKFYWQLFCQRERIVYLLNCYEIIIIKVLYKSIEYIVTFLDETMETKFSRDASNENRRAETHIDVRQRQA